MVSDTYNVFMSLNLYDACMSRIIYTVWCDTDIWDWYKESQREADIIISYYRSILNIYSHISVGGGVDKFSFLLVIWRKPFKNCPAEERIEK